MKKFLLLLLPILLLGSSAGHAQTPALPTNSCGQSTSFASGTITASGNTQLVAAPTVSTKAIHICSVTIQVIQGATPANFGLTYGTGTACATGTANLTPMFLGMASSSQSWGPPFGSNNLLNVPAGNALCLNLSSAPTGAVVHVTYQTF